MGLNNLMVFDSAVIFLLFILGISIGSFLNVLIDRLARDESILKGRSYCESCKKKLIFYDLIPVLSFIFLKGRCRYCHSPISFYYPMVELITGVLFVAMFIFLSTDGIRYQVLGIRYVVSFVYYLVIVSSLIVIFFTDLKYGIIPDKIVYPTTVVSLFFLATSYQLPATSYMFSALGAFLFFLLLYFVTKGRGMGFGDVKLAFLMGLFLGFPKIIIALYTAFLTGALVSLMLIAAGKKRLSKDTIPFGPFLVLGTLMAFFFGDKIAITLLPFILFK